MTSGHSPNQKTLNAKESYEKTLKEGRILKKEVVEGILEAYHKNVGYFEDSNSPTTHVRNMEFFYAMAIHELLQLKKSPKEENAANNKNTNIPLEKDLDARITLYAESLQVLLHNSSKLKTIKQSNIAGWLRVYYKHSKHGSISNNAVLTNYAEGVYKKIEPYLTQKPQKHETIPEETENSNKDDKVLNILNRSDIIKHEVGSFLTRKDLTALQKATRVTTEDLLYFEHSKPANMDELRKIKNKTTSVLDLRLLLASLCDKQEAAWCNVPEQAITEIGNILKTLKKYRTIHLGALDYYTEDKKLIDKSRISKILKEVSQYAKKSSLERVSLVGIGGNNVNNVEFHNIEMIEELLKDTRLHVTAYFPLALNRSSQKHALATLQKTYSERLNSYIYTGDAYHKIYVPKNIEALQKLEGKTVDMLSLSFFNWEPRHQERIQELLKQTVNSLSKIVVKHGIDLGNMGDFVCPYTNDASLFKDMWDQLVVNRLKSDEKNPLRKNTRIFWQISSDIRILKVIKKHFDETNFFATYPDTKINCCFVRETDSPGILSRLATSMPNVLIQSKGNFSLSLLKDDERNMIYPANLSFDKLTLIGSLLKQETVTFLERRTPIKNIDISDASYINLEKGLKIKKLRLYRARNITIKEGVTIENLEILQIFPRLKMTGNLNVSNITVAIDLEQCFSTYHAKKCRSFLQKINNLKHLTFSVYNGSVHTDPSIGKEKSEDNLLTECNFLVLLLNNPALNKITLKMISMDDRKEEDVGHNVQLWYSLRDKLLKNRDTKDILAKLEKDELELLGKNIKNLEGYLKDNQPNNNDLNKEDMNSNEPKTSYDNPTYNLIKKVVEAHQKNPSETLENPESSTEKIMIKN